MTPGAKAGVVIAGYAAAVAIAFLVAHLYVALTPGVDRQLYSGMSAFGDSLLFLGAFALAAIPATVAALYFLRPYRRAWIALSIAALVIASSALIACFLQLAARDAASGSRLAAWAMVAPLRILVAPVFALLVPPRRPGGAGASATRHAARCRRRRGRGVRPGGVHLVSREMT